MAWGNKTAAEGAALAGALPGRGKRGRRVFAAGAGALLRLTVVAVLLCFEAMALTLMELQWIFVANLYLLPLALFSLIGLRGGSKGKRGSRD
ncbi:hypothetical protein [Desulfuromonas soudanensis]|nr:hypothetical protein [Desulfuromonas soudanensis]